MLRLLFCITMALLFTNKTTSAIRRRSCFILDPVMSQDVYPKIKWQIA